MLVVEHHTAQMRATLLPQRVEAGDELLARVAALGEAHGASTTMPASWGMVRSSSSAPISGTPASMRTAR